MAKKTLLQKAQESVRVRTKIEVGEEEIELFVAWLDGKVDIYQVRQALGVKDSYKVYMMFIRVVETLYNNGRMTIK